MKNNRITILILTMVLLLVSGFTGWIGSVQAQSGTKTYVIGTDVTLHPLNLRILTVILSASIWISWRQLRRIKILNMRSKH